MTNKTFRGDAPAKAQIEKYELPSPLNDGQTIRLKINNKSITHTIGDETVDSGETQANAIVDDLVSAWQGSGFPEFDEVVPSNEGDDKLTLTAATAGVPFIVVSSLEDSDENALNFRQVISIRNSPTGGNFTLTVRNKNTDQEETTGNIAYNASASDVETALEGISFIDAADVATSGGSLPGTDVTVEWTGSFAGESSAQITEFDESGLTGGDATISVSEKTKGVPKQDEKQKIELFGDYSGGEFQIQLEGNITDGIAYNASTTTVKNALEDLPTIASGDISVTAGDVNADGDNDNWTVTFSGTRSGDDVPIMDIITDALTGGSISTSVTVVQHGKVGSPAPDRYYTFDSDFSSASVALDSFGHSDLESDGSPSQQATGVINSATTLAESDGDLFYDPANGAIAGAPDFNNGFTFTIWFRVSDSAETGVLASSQNTDDGQNQWKLEVDANNDNVTLTVDFGNATTKTLTVSETLDTTNYNFAVVRVDNDSRKISLSVTQSTASNLNIFQFIDYPTDAIAPLTEGDEQFIIGGKHDGGYGGRSADYSGDVDEVGIWTRDSPDGTKILTYDQANALFNGGNGARPGTGQNEIQELTINGTPSQGTVKATFKGKSVDLDYNSSASDAESDLEGLSTIETGNISVTKGDWPGTKLRVEFINDLGGADQPKIQLDGNDIRSTVTETQKGSTGTNEVQKVEITGVDDDSDVHDGTFTLSFGSTSPTTTNNIDFNASKETVEAELESLGDIDDVDVTNGPLRSSPFEVEFKGTNKNTDVALMTSSESLDSGRITLSGTGVGLTDRTQKSRGPNHFDDPLNWNDETLPAASDDIFLQNNNTDILYGLKLLEGSTISSLIQYANYTGNIGLSKENQNGYEEYRPRFLKVGITTLKIGVSDGSGVGRFNVDLESSATPTITVFTSSGTVDAGVPAVSLIANNSSTTLTMFGGSVGAAIDSHDTSTIDEIIQRGGRLILGDGVTIGSTGFEKTAGSLEVDRVTVNGPFSIRG